MKVEVVAGVAWMTFLALGVTTIGAALSRPGSRRFQDQPYSEIVRANPPAAFFVTWGRMFPTLLKATVVAGCVALGAVLIAAA